MDKFAQIADLLSVIQTCRMTGAVCHGVFQTGADGKSGSEASFLVALNRPPELLKGSCASYLRLQRTFLSLKVARIYSGTPNRKID